MEQNGTEVHTSARKVPEESRSFVHCSFRVTTGLLNEPPTAGPLE
jgi:hypothetical protein